MRHFPEVQRFLDECLFHGGRVLLHGNAGISRRSAINELVHAEWTFNFFPNPFFSFCSGALLIAYIMQKYDYCYNDALRVVQSKRFCVSPNEGFKSQLEVRELTRCGAQGLNEEKKK